MTLNLGRCRKNDLSMYGRWVIYGRYPVMVVVVMPLFIVVIDEEVMDMLVFRCITCAK
jgi:hypothetical protein